MMAVWMVTWVRQRVAQQVWIASEYRNVRCEFVDSSQGVMGILQNSYSVFGGAEGSRLTRVCSLQVMSQYVCFASARKCVCACTWLYVCVHSVDMCVLGWLHTCDYVTAALGFLSRNLLACRHLDLSLLLLFSSVVLSAVMICSYSSRQRLGSVSLHDGPSDNCLFAFLFHFTCVYYWEFGFSFVLLVAIDVWLLNQFLNASFVEPM